MCHFGYVKNVSLRVCLLYMVITGIADTLDFVQALLLGSMEPTCALRSETELEVIFSDIEHDRLDISSL